MAFFNPPTNSNGHNFIHYGDDTCMYNDNSSSYICSKDSSSYICSKCGTICIVYQDTFDYFINSGKGYILINGLSCDEVIIRDIIT
jgi:hypothetical protein